MDERRPQANDCNKRGLPLLYEGRSLRTCLVLIVQPGVVLMCIAVLYVGCVKSDTECAFHLASLSPACRPLCFSLPLCACTRSCCQLSPMTCRPPRKTRRPLSLSALLCCTKLRLTGQRLLRSMTTGTARRTTVLEHRLAIARLGLFTTKAETHSYDTKM